MQKQEQEQRVPLIVKNPRVQRQLQHSNQHLPSQQIKSHHQYGYLRFQLAKSRFQMSILAFVSSIIGYVGVRYAISIWIPVGEMSSYASAFGGVFPPDFGAQVGAIVLFGLLCMLLLERINPDVARRMKETYRQD